MRPSAGLAAAALLAACLLATLPNLSDAQSMCGPGMGSCPYPGPSGTQGCCSRSGYCGGWDLNQWDSWCGSGCQSAYGRCYGSANPTVTSSPPPPPTGSSGWTGCTYTVQSGEYCCMIAYKLGTVVQRLYDHNSVIEQTSYRQCTNLYPGQILNIPCGLLGPGTAPEPETNKECITYNCLTYGKCGTAASPPPPPSASCFDGIQNQYETDVDCGNNNNNNKCSPCSNGKKCYYNGDCQSQLCSWFAGQSTGTCTAAATCSDGIKNQDETSVDCGGSKCPKCADLKPCNANSDCQNGYCSWSTCVSCSDSVRDQDETDVDCGGSKCPKCPNDRTCISGYDCQSGYCGANGRCSTQATCYDGIKNQGESDVDCGGKLCPKCANNKYCSMWSDCQSSNCESGKCAPYPTCSDGIRNQDETDVDCGGSTCPAKCSNNKYCVSWTDCQSSYCLNGKCATRSSPPPPPAASCSDGKKNQDETDVDCGGSKCPSCANNKYCVSWTDCQSSYCLNGKCATRSSPPPPAASCTDGKQNGGESDVDCGGSTNCQRCQKDKKCTTGSDCSTGLLCSGSKCALPPSPPPPPAKCTYVVQKGDTCCTIAKAKGTCLTSLFTLNPWLDQFTAQKCTNIGPGVSIDVPCKPDGGSSGCTTPSSCSSNCVYSVQSGDTCGCIAKKLGINTATLYGMNPWISTSPIKCSNLCLDCKIMYPCTPSSSQATGSDKEAVCPAPPPPEPPCYGSNCPVPTPCVPDMTAAICAQAASTFGLPGACFKLITNLTDIPYQCPCMCAGICSANSCGDGVCTTVNSKITAKCGVCKCTAPATKPPPPPPAPPPAKVPACSDPSWSPNFYISNPSLSVSSGMCIGLNATNGLVLKSCKSKSASTDLFAVSKGYPDAWFTIKNIKTGLCIELTSTSSTSIDPIMGTTTTVTVFRASLKTCDSTKAGQNWMYSYYLGLLQCKTGHFLASVGDNMAAGTPLMGYPVTYMDPKPYALYSRSWIFWPNSGPKCGFTGAVVSLSPDDLDHSNAKRANVTWPSKLGVLPVLDSSSKPKNLQLCLDATTIQVYRGNILGMVSFLPCVAGKASQYLQTINYLTKNFSVAVLGSAAVGGVTNDPPGWPEGHFFLTFPKVKPNLCFDVYNAMGMGVAIISFKCHAFSYPGNQLWSADWTRGHIVSALPAPATQSGVAVCAHFDRNALDVFSGNCSGTMADNKYLWKYSVADQTPFQVNYPSLIEAGR